MSAQFKDDVFIHIEDEFKQIQQCPGMYISSRGTEGALHLFKEIVNNSIDESTNINSPCNKIEIIFDEETQHFVVADNGRGIPFDKMVEVCTEKHSSTKYDRSNNVYSAGCNGVGIKVTIAFSKLFSMESFRDGKIKLISFHNCNMVEEPVKTDKDDDSHGLIVNFIPSEEYLGQVNIKTDDCLEWLRHMSYVMPDGLEIIYSDYNDGSSKDPKIRRKFSHQGLSSNVKFLSSNLEFDPINIKYSESDEPGSLKLEMSFSYDKTIEEESVDSYCNYVWTFGGGYHVNTCRSALADFMVKAARNADPNHKYPVIAQDVRKGLVMAIDCKWSQVILGGQHKSTVESEEIDDIGRKGITNALNEFFSVNQALLNKLISYYRQMAKIRLESNKIKGIKPPKAMTIYDEADIQGFTPLADSNKKGYKELIITEGESAAGAIIAARNPFYQAVYHTQGVMKNCTEISLQEVMKSRVPRDLAKILGVEPGPNFDINNLRYNKIIFMQDADADGKNIRSLASAYLIMWMPQLIEEGRLYAGVPPLYTLSDKAIKKHNVEKGFLFDKHEFFKLFNEIIAKNVDLWLFDEDEKTLIPQTKSQIKMFLDKNKNYLDLLEELSNTKEACDTKIIEHICNAIVKYGLGSEEMVKYLNQALPEMTYDKESMSLIGSFETAHFGLIIDERFIQTAEKFLDVFESNPSMWVCFKNKNSSNDDVVKTTIGEFFKDILNRYNIDVSQRFKGLGEAKAELLFWTTLNPKVRKLIRLTMEDRNKVLETVKVLHGSKTSELKRQMLDRAVITDDDIDN